MGFLSADEVTGRVTGEADIGANLERWKESSGSVEFDPNLYGWEQDRTDFLLWGIGPAVLTESLIPRTVRKLG